MGSLGNKPGTSSLLPAGPEKLRAASQSSLARWEGFCKFGVWPGATRASDPGPELGVVGPALPYPVHLARDAKSTENGEARARFYAPNGCPPPIPTLSPTLGCSSCLEIRDISCRADASEALPSRPAGHTASPGTPPGLRLPGGRHWGAGDRPSSEATSPLAGRRAQLPLGKPSRTGHHPPGSSTGLGRRRRKKKWGTPGQTL